MRRKPRSGILRMMHVKPARVFTAVDWEINLGADDSAHRVTPGWCPQLSLAFLSVALQFFVLFCGVEGVQMLNHFPLKTFGSAVGLSRDSHSRKDVQILNGFHSKSDQQSCGHHVRRFFDNDPSVS